MRIQHRRRISRIGGAVCCALALAVTASCAKEESRPEVEVERVVYSVRGEVTQIPSKASPASEFRVHHEPIPEFLATWPDGAKGMNSMNMPFALGDGVALTGITEGTIVTLDFAVDYDVDTGAIQDYEVVSIETLPADTELSFGKVGDAAADQPDHQ